MKSKKNNILNVLIFLAVLFVVVGVLMLPPVKNWVIYYWIVLANNLNDLTYEYPLLSIGICVLFVILAGIASAFLELDEERY